MARPPSEDVIARELSVLELKRAGHTYQEIAAALGYADRSAARRTYIRALQRTLAEPASEMRELENARLDRLQTAHWKNAVEYGDEKAADIILKIMKRRAALNGLDLPSKIEHTGPGGNPLTVVIDPSMLPATGDPDADGDPG